ncbi:AraC family transcriptional regulator [Foetidibacter luteolus]|uniref:AraC family transcriptional regulator n=1 Tax=Foetidibacter luteolus TaxID=2608880 RepID=UPI00129A1BD4|nr:helix-turn-helix domain-containing protein [Foetidibacter luteolus]
MIYQTFAPPQILQPYVRYFWALELEVGNGDSYTHRTMACGCPELVFHYKGAFEPADGSAADKSPALFHAQSSSYRRFTTMESFGIFGAFIYPFAVPRLFGQSAAATSNCMIGLANLLGSKGRMLEEQMMLANNNSQRLQILCGFLEKKLVNPPAEQHPVIEAIKYIVHTNEFITVNELSGQFNLSARQLERRFNDFAGFSPKFFNRLARFEKALAKYPKLPGTSLTGIAYDCGYYDQSHFIHDFKQFSGYHPKQYFSGNFEGHEYKDEAAD